MNVLPERKYGDPLNVLLRAEEETCKGCRWRPTAIEGDHCKRPHTEFVLAVMRCKFYEERE